jgi:hypothetical protein
MNNITNNISQETINNVLIDILKGAKDASSEIYGASKAGIVKAVDFAQEQAPMVVQEFLTWKFAQSVIWTVVGVIALVVLTVIFLKLKKLAVENANTGLDVLGFFGMVICIITFLCVCGGCVIPNVEQMVKVKVAPRVYIIEWVSDQVQGKHNHRR